MYKPRWSQNGQKLCKNWDIKFVLSYAIDSTKKRMGVYLTGRKQIQIPILIVLYRTRRILIVLLQGNYITNSSKTGKYISVHLNTSRIFPSRIGRQRKHEQSMQAMTSLMTLLR